MGARPDRARKPGFWENTATTTTAIHGSSSATGRLTWLAGASRELSLRPRAPRASCSSDRMGRVTAGTARRRAPDRRDGYQAQRATRSRRLPRTTLGADRRAARRRRGLAVPRRRAQAGRRARAPGPIGGYFVGEESVSGPVLLIAGGSGIVPFRAMLRHRAASVTASGPAALLLAVPGRGHLPQRADALRRGPRSKSASR